MWLFPGFPLFLVYCSIKLIYMWIYLLVQEYEENKALIIIMLIVPFSYQTLIETLNICYM